MMDRPFTMDDLRAAEELVAKCRTGDYGIKAGPFTVAAPIAGVRIVTSPLLTDTILHPRSPSRAKRRAARGFRQHTITIPSTTAYRIGDGVMVMHPAQADAIKARLDAEVREFVVGRP